MKGSAFKVISTRYFTFLLLYYNLIKLNQQNISVGIQLQQGDILECYFGLLVDSYQESIFYLTEKYKF